MTDDLREVAERWLADDPDPAARDEIRALLAIGFIANLLVRPVPSRYHEPSTKEEVKAA